jgi:hypothetical protein
MDFRKVVAGDDEVNISAVAKGRLIAQASLSSAQLMLQLRKHAIVELRNFILLMKC